MEHITKLLWQRAEEALYLMAKEFGVRLQRIAMNILGSREDAEETVSDTYLAVWNAVPPRQPEPLAAFVYRTGRNIALNRLRHDTALKRSGYEVSLDELGNYLAGPDLWETVSARDLGRSIDRFLNTLSKQSRIIFLRRYWFGDSVKDIAKDLELSESAVSVRLSRTRAALKQQLVLEGYYE